MTTRDLGTPLRGVVEILETQEQFPVPANFDSDWMPDMDCSVIAPALFYYSTSVYLSYNPYAFPPSLEVIRSGMTVLS
jgi:hypothetical protein